MVFGLFPSRKCLHRCGFPSRNWPEVIAGRMTGRVIPNASVLVTVMPNITFQLKPPSHLLREAQGGSSLIMTLRVDQVSFPVQGSFVYGLILEVTWYVNKVFDAQYMTLQVHLPSNRDSQWEQLYFPGDVFSIWRHYFQSQARGIGYVKNSCSVAHSSWPRGLKHGQGY